MPPTKRKKCPERCPQRLESVLFLFLGGLILGSSRARSGSGRAVSSAHFIAAGLASVTAAGCAYEKRTNKAFRLSAPLWSGWWVGLNDPPQQLEPVTASPQRAFYTVCRPSKTLCRLHKVSSSKTITELLLFVNCAFLVPEKQKKFVFAYKLRF